MAIESEEKEASFAWMSLIPFTRSGFFFEISNSPGTLSGWIVGFQMPEQCMSPCTALAVFLLKCKPMCCVIPLQTLCCFSVWVSSGP